MTPNPISRPARRRPVTVLAMALVVLASACGIPEDDSPRALDPPTPTPVLEAPTPTPVVTRAFTIYLLDSAGGQLRPVERQLPERLTVSALLDELREVPTEQETDAGLVSVIPPETVFFADPTTNSGLAILDFATGSFDTLGSDTLRDALAQLVWTLTESPTISGVIIRIEGLEERWPTDGDDASILRRFDYATHDPDFVPPTPEPIDEEPPAEEEPTPTPPTAEPTPEPTPADDDG